MPTARLRGGWWWTLPALTGLIAAGVLLLPLPAPLLLLGAVLLGTGVALAGRRLLDLRLERATAALTGLLDEPAAEDFDWSATAGPFAEAAAAFAGRLEQRVEGLAEERRRVTEVLEELDAAILLFSDGLLVQANRSARALFDLNGAARSPMRVLGDAALADAVARARRSGVSVDLTTRRGERTLTARAVRSGPGEVALVVHDVTDAQRLEAIRRDFVTNASHELKTPVAGIQALSDSLAFALRADPERAARMVERLEHEADRLATLVRDLLDLARLEESAAAHGAARRVPLDLAELVASQADRVAQLAGARAVTVTLDLPARAVLAAVPEDVRLIVDNLLENAVRYNRAGGTVEVRVEVTERTVVLVVADSGIGIPEADRERIFERFYRIDKARSRAVGGTGLGLSLVRNAVARHGGRLTLDSELGAGSVFTVELPRALTAAPEAAQPGPATPAA